MDDCFIICPLGDEGSEIRQRSDKFFKHVFQPVLSNNKYTAIRADQVPKSGLITTQIINLIIGSPLVVADLTDANPNVFYELAVRHATRKPYIQVISKGQQIPFDLSGIRTIEIDITDLDNVEKAREEIEKQIKEFQGGYIPDSPISVATSARLLQEDSDFAEEVAARISEFTQWQIDSRYNYYSADHDPRLELILNKLFGLNEYSPVSLDEINRKLDEVLKRLG